MVMWLFFKELYRAVIAILNKLTPQKFKTLIDQIIELKIDSPERLEGVIDRIFEKVSICRVNQVSKTLS